jgi:ribonuclease BN (tRNA processing enzyme)
LALCEQRYTFLNLESVDISHLHAAHVGGLEWLAFTSKFDPQCPKPHLYACEDILKDLWDKTLSGGLSSIQGINADLTTYFEVHSVKQNDFFTWQQVEFHLVQTVHFSSGFAIMPTYGLFFTVNGYNVFITTDTQYTPYYFESIYRRADIIFHDCETSAFKSGVHAHYSELIMLEPEIKKKMWLYHYNGKPLPNAKKVGVAGFVNRGQSFALKFN